MHDFILNISNVALELLGKQLFYSTLVFSMVYVITRLLRNKSPFLHFGLWSLVILRLLLPPSLAAPWSLGTVLYHHNQMQHDLPTDLTAGEEQAVLLKVSNDQPQEKATGMMHTLIFTGWITGAMFFLLVFIYRRNRIGMIIKQAAPVNSAEIVTYLAYWRNHFGIKRNIRVLASPKITTPFTMGWRQPVICLPAGLDTSGAKPAPIIAHECAHIARQDDLQIILLAVLQAIYFFNPLVWYTGVKLNQSRELLCDQMVLGNQSIERRAYAASLLYVLKNNSGAGCTFTLLPEYGRRSAFIIDRIHKISRGRLMKTNHTLHGLVVLLLGLMVLPMAVYTPVSLAKSPAPAATATPADDTDIDFTCPLNTGSITAGFQEMVDPFTGKKRFHQGVDIKASKGTDVLAAADGKVIKTVTEYTLNKGRGRYLVLQHGNGLTSLYSHMDKISVTDGETVRAGQIIGKVGTTGRSTGPHLHFEIMQDGECQNPANYIDFNAGLAN